MLDQLCPITPSIHLSYLHFYKCFGEEIIRTLSHVEFIYQHKEKHLLIFLSDPTMLDFGLMAIDKILFYLCVVSQFV